MTTYVVHHESRHPEDSKGVIGAYSVLRDAYDVACFMVPGDEEPYQGRRWGDEDNTVWITEVEVRAGAYADDSWRPAGWRDFIIVSNLAPTSARLS
jgi:hypothetical protein